MASARSRRRQAQSQPASPVTEASHGEPERIYPRWRWRTFPVFCAFVVGLLVASFINGRPQNDAAAVVQIVAVLGLGYCITHLFVMNVVVAGRMKRRRDSLARGETPEDEFETELVSPAEDEGGGGRG